MSKCKTCKNEIEVAIFKGSGACSTICQKVQAKEIDKKTAKALRESAIKKD